MENWFPGRRRKSKRKKDVGRGWVKREGRGEGEEEGKGRNTPSFSDPPFLERFHLPKHIRLLNTSRWFHWWVHGPTIQSPSTSPASEHMRLWGNSSSKHNIEPWTSKGLGQPHSVALLVAAHEAFQAGSDTAVVFTSRCLTFFAPSPKLPGVSTVLLASLSQLHALPSQGHNARSPRPSHIWRKASVIL